MRSYVVVVLVGCGFRAAPGGLADARDPKDAPTGGAAGYVQGASGTDTTSATFTSMQQEGDLDLVVLSWTNTAQVLAVTDVAGNTYAPADTPLYYNGLSHAVFYAANIHAAAGNTVTALFASTPSSPDVRMTEYAGLTTSPIDVVKTGTGTSNASDSGTAVTTHAHDLIIGANTVYADTTGPGAMFTERLLVRGDIVEDREVAAAGSYDTTAPMSGNAPWAMTLIAVQLQ